MTMRPGPRMASSVRRRAHQPRRGAISPCRMVPSAPRMSPTWASSRTAPRRGSVPGGAARRSSRFAAFISPPPAQIGCADPGGERKGRGRSLRRNSRNSRISWAINPTRIKAALRLWSSYGLLLGRGFIRSLIGCMTPGCHARVSIPPSDKIKGKMQAAMAINIALYPPGFRQSGNPESRCDAKVIAELRFDHPDSRFDVRPLMLAERCTLGLPGRKVAPARHPLDADGDDREVVEHHLLILRVARPEQRLRLVVFGAVGQDLGRAAQHDPAEPGPVLVPAIGDKRGDWIFDDVPQALQRADVALRLLIDRDVERALAHDKAHRNEMRCRSRIGGREMTDPAASEKTGLLLRQHAEISHDFGSTDYPVMPRFCPHDATRL